MPYDLLVPAAKRRQVTRGQLVLAAGVLPLACGFQAIPACAATAQPVQSAAAGDAPVAALKRVSSADGSLTIDYSWDAAVVRVGDFQVLHVHVVRAPAACTRSQMNLLVDGSMPDHGHGLNYRVVVQPGSRAAQFEARGIMFHMQGGWELHVDIQCGSTRVRAFIPVSVQ